MLAPLEVDGDTGGCPPRARDIRNDIQYREGLRACVSLPVGEAKPQTALREIVESALETFATFGKCCSI